MQTITPFLWFDDNAEEAIDFYLSIFKDGKKQGVTRYGDSGPGPAGKVMTAEFELKGQRFVALNGGPHFKFNEAVSFAISCETQQEIDELWEKLTAGGGSKGQCGWLKDKFGLSWQVVPRKLPELIKDKSPAKSQSVMRAMMQMTKLDIAELEKASEKG
jgi:predicted 3-demethylubiquinone-9 3-methyltransferase (glyoxalase superfamily)